MKDYDVLMRIETDKQEYTLFSKENSGSVKAPCETSLHPALPPHGRYLITGERRRGSSEVGVRHITPFAKCACNTQ